jgi:uncharacterized protein YbjT (DUF2867 family)
MANRAIIAGASGLIGSSLLAILLQQPEYDEVLVLVRTLLPDKHPKLKQQIVDFDALDKYADVINGHALFCCLGSTKKKTPDLAEYRKVDHDYPLHLAQLAKTNGIAQFHLVSSIGANASSSFYYTKIKGEMEDDIKSVGLSSLHIYQPSTLTGKRKELRLLEIVTVPIIKLLDPLLIGGLKKYRSIPAATVAMAMYKQSLKNETGVFTYPSDKIKTLS